MRRTVTALPLAMASLLGACGAAPDYAPPASSFPAQYKNGAALEARSAGEVADLSRWWKSFDDPLLERLVDQGLSQNLDLEQAQARVTQARAALRAYNAALLPTGQISGQAGQAYQSIETPVGRVANAFPGFNRSVSTYEANLGASWEIDLFGGKDAARDAARADWQASEAAAVAVRLAVASQIADTYVTIRMLQGRLAVARDQVETQAKLAGLVRLQFSKGLASELQVNQVDGALAQVRASVPALQNELDVALNALSVLLGQQPGGFDAALSTPVPIPVAPTLSTAGGPAALLRRRPDIIAAERKLAASNARIGAAMSEYYPKFSLNGLIGTATTNVGGLFTGNAAQASGILGLRWRLFDFGRVDAEIAAAKGQNAEALAGYKLTVLRASQDVENAFSALVQQEARATALSEGEASLTKARSRAEVAYRGGIASLIEILDADRRLLEVRDSVLQAKAGTARGAVASFRALGGGWNPHSR